MPRPDFKILLKNLLMSGEYNKTEEEADRLIKSHTNIVVNGIMAWNLNATAMALEMADTQK